MKMLTAKKMIEVHGQSLVGKTVMTMAVGNWPGGMARVLNIQPDPAAPEIAFNVVSVASGDEIGIFENEKCGLVDMSEVSSDQYTLKGLSPDSWFRVAAESTQNSMLIVEWVDNGGNVKVGYHHRTDFAPK